MSLTPGHIAAALVATNADNRRHRIISDDTKTLDNLVAWLRRLLSADDPPTGIAALAGVEETPDSLIRLHELAQVFNQRARCDSGFRGDLEALISQARIGGIDISSITQTVWGNQPDQAPS